MLGGIALAINIAIYAVVLVRHRRTAAKEHMIGTHDLGFPGMAGLGANRSALGPHDRHRVCVGQVAKRIVATTAVRACPANRQHWVEAVVGAVARRVPFWSVLVGVYVAAGLWAAPENCAMPLDKGLYVVAAASLTFLVSEVLVRLVRTHGPALDSSLRTTTLTENLVRIVVVIVGLLVVLTGLGLQITPMLTALGVGGLAIALALQDTLANLFAGFLTVAKHIRIGNYIKLSSGEEGYLVDIDWRASRLRQLTNNTVLVPNAKFSQSIVTNYHSPEHELVVTIEASVDYGSDLDRVEAITAEVARDVMRTVQGGVANFEPVVRFHTFGDPGIGFSVILRAQEFVDQFLIKHEFVKRLHKRFAAEGIAIPIKSIAQRQRRPAAAVKAFYYGWVVLLVAAAAMVGTLPGRTQGLGLITEPLLSDLGIGRVDYAQLNLWATLIGAAGAIGIGRFIDRFGSRVVLTVVAAALGVTVVLMSRVTTFTGLAVAVTLTRALGQSALSVVSIAMVGQWFVRRIDMAMAIYSVVLSVGFMIAFPVVGSLVQSRGWRAAWFAVGAAILAGLVPLALFFVRRSPESIGLAADGYSAGGSALPVPGSGSSAERGTRNAELEPQATRSAKPCAPLRSGSLPSAPRFMVWWHRASDCSTNRSSRSEDSDRTSITRHSSSRR